MPSAMPSAMHSSTPRAKRSRRGTAPLVLGSLLIVAALGLSAYNIWDDVRAGNRAQATALQLQEQLVDSSRAGLDDALEGMVGVLDSPVRDTAMPTSVVDGLTCVALLSIPDLDLVLPVQSECTYEALYATPCRFSGSVYSGDLVIAGHSYESHFGRLDKLQPGDTLTLLDMAGNSFTFQVSCIEVMEPHSVEEMVSSPYDLTLFTCTFDGQSRLALRCLGGVKKI